MVTRRAGNGRSAIIAVDDTWRWRRWVDDRYLHAFHSGLIRFAAANRTLGRSPWSLRVSPLRCHPGELLRLSLVPQGNPPEGLPQVINGALTQAATTNEQKSIEERFSLRRGDDTFHAQISAPGPGNWTIAIRPDPLLGDVTPVMVQVSIPRAELDDTRLDRRAMETLAKQTGGKILFAPSEEKSPSNPEKLPANATTNPASDSTGAQGNNTTSQRCLNDLPDLSGEQESRTLQPLWDSPWALAILVLLLGLDWSLRRWHRLP